MFRLPRVAAALALALFVATLLVAKTLAVHLQTCTLFAGAMAHCAPLPLPAAENTTERVRRHKRKAPPPHARLRSHAHGPPSLLLGLGLGGQLRRLDPERKHVFAKKGRIS